jgi:hypothetical protein
MENAGGTLRAGVNTCNFPISSYSRFLCVFRQWSLRVAFGCALMNASLVVVSQVIMTASGGHQALRMEGAGERNDAWAHVEQSQL